MKRIFIPGDRWIYYKIYCGPYTTQSVLINKLTPLIKVYLETNKILKWFFVRYSDPEFHLRLRIEVNDHLDLFTILQDFSETLGNLVESNLIWNIDISTYKRELERYGKENISITESLFFLSATRISNLLIQKCSNEEYSLLVLQSVDKILSMFGLSLDEKLAFAKANRDYFKSEFESNKSLNKIINLEYSRIQTQIAIASIAQSAANDYFINPYNNEELDFFVNSIIDNLKKTSMTLTKYMSSLVHMHLNRAFMDNTRYYEFITHSLLYKHYAFSRVALKKTES